MVEDSIRKGEGRGGGGSQEGREEEVAGRRTKGGAGQKLKVILRNHLEEIQINNSQRH